MWPGPVDIWDGQFDRFVVCCLKVLKPLLDFDSMSWSSDCFDLVINYLVLLGLVYRSESVLEIR